MSIPTRRSTPIVDGTLITDKLWGLYYKPDFNFGGVQGGAMPYKVEADPDEVAVDPYGPDSPDFVVGDDFIEMWCSALAHLPEALRGPDRRTTRRRTRAASAASRRTISRCSTVFRENVYVIADSNHGYKMIGVGKLVAEEICGEKSALLEPFRFSRYAEGKLHPVSNSPFPWS